MTEHANGTDLTTPTEIRKMGHGDWIRYQTTTGVPGLAAAATDLDPDKITVRYMHMEWFHVSMLDDAPVYEALCRSSRADAERDAAADPNLTVAVDGWVQIVEGPDQVDPWKVQTHPDDEPVTWGPEAGGPAPSENVRILWTFGWSTYLGPKSAL